MSAMVKDKKTTRRAVRLPTNPGELVADAPSESKQANDSRPQEVLDPLDAAALVAKHVELRDVRMHHIDASMLCSLDYALQTDWEIQHSKPAHGCTLNERSNVLDVVVSVEVKLAAAEKSAAAEKHLGGKKEVARFAVSFVLSYQLLIPPPPDSLRANLFDGFASINGVYNAWPYIREAIQNTTARMCLPPLTLPVYRVPKAKKQSPPRVAGPDEK